MECRRVRDLPTGPALLALAREVLLHDLMPLLPPEAHLEARLVANSIAKHCRMAGTLAPNLDRWSAVPAGSHTN